MSEREWIESLKPAGTDEALMVGPDGLITEGLASNFFVIRPSPDAPHTLEVVSSPVGSTVLPGIIRSAVVEACEGLGVRFVEERPWMSDVGTWSACFITNAIRLVQPVGSLIVLDERGTELGRTQFTQAGEGEGSDGPLLVSRLSAHVRFAAGLVS